MSTINSKQIIFLVVMAIVIFVVCGVLLWQQQAEIAIARQNIGRLEQDVSILNNQLASCQSATDAPQDSILENQSCYRVVLTDEIMSEFDERHQERCNEPFNYDPANTTVTYSSRIYGLSVDIPYNENWGNYRFKLLPYQEYGKTADYNARLVFGPMGLFEACSWVRSNAIEFLPARDAKSVVNDLMAMDQNNNLYSLEPEIVTINNFEVVKYKVRGLCDSPTIIVIGEKYNYSFHVACGDDATFQSFEDIIETIQLIQ